MAPGSLAHTFLAAAYNNAWSNHRLLAACSALTDEEFAAARTSFFPSIKGTLNHNLTVDWYYLEILERSLAGLPPHPQAGRHFEPEEPFATCAPLSEAQHAADRRLVDLCKGSHEMDATILLPRREGVVRDRLARILAHLFQHQIHHRGQAHAMLAGTRVKPPQLDEFYCANEAHKREREFAELGFSEADVWGAWTKGP